MREGNGGSRKKTIKKTHSPQGSRPEKNAKNQQMGKKAPSKGSQSMKGEMGETYFDVGKRKDSRKGYAGKIKREMKKNGS